MTSIKLIYYLINRNKTSATNTPGTKRTTNFILTYNGIEIGVGDIKPPGANEALVDEDRGRIAETTTKKQLHVRIKRQKYV